MLLATNVVRHQFDADRPLFYLHIPKCGGTSLNVLLREKFPPGAIHNTEHHRERARLLTNQVGPFACYSGHASYRFRDLLPPATTVITFLRCPIERAISHFYFIQSLGRDGLTREGAPAGLMRCCDLTLAEFTRKMPRLAKDTLGSLQTAYLGAPAPAITPIATSVSRATLDVARRNLDQTAFVGLTERMDESVTALCRLFDWYLPPSTPHVNRTLTRPAVADLDTETRVLLDEWTAMDAELYRQAVARFDSECGGATGRPCAPASAEFTAAGESFGWGWWGQESWPFGAVRWTGEVAGVEFRLAGGGTLDLTLDVLTAVDPSQLDNLCVAINDQPITLVRMRTPEGVIRYVGKVRKLERGEARYRVEIHVPALRPCDYIPGSTDTRPLGVAVSRLEIAFKTPTWFAGIHGWPWGVRA